jgi:hypothetical protein
MAKQANENASPNGDAPSEFGSLGQRVAAYDSCMRELILNARTADDWAPLSNFVDTEAFTRTGCFLERHDWQGYLDMLVQWAGSTGRFETKLLHLTECGSKVFYEIQETHHRTSQEIDVVNSMTAFEFNDAGKIVALRVYLQKKL